MPPVAPRSHPRHSGLLRLALILGAIAAIIVAVLLFTAGFFAGVHSISSSSVTFVAADAAASFDITGGTATFGKAVDTLGPLTIPDGGTLSATLAMGQTHGIPVPGGPPIVVAPPKNEWHLQSGSSATSTLGRPLGLMKDGTALALTDKGLIAYVPGGKVTVVSGAGTDLVGAVSADGTLAALENPSTHGTDLYAVAPQSLKSIYLESIPGETTAIAFDDAGTLFILTKDGTVSSYVVSADAASMLTGTAELANPWP